MSLGELVFRPFVGRDEIRAPLKTLAWKASIRRGVPPKPSNLALLKTKLLFLLLCISKKPYSINLICFVLHIELISFSYSEI